MSQRGIAIQLEADVQAAARGDERAFARLVDATRSVVSSIALAIVRDPELSRDVAQDVYLAVWQDLGRLRQATSFLPWLRQVTRNRAHHLLRTRARQEKRVRSTTEDSLLATAADPRPGAMTELLDRETRRMVADAVDRLPPGSREVVILYYREGESTRQVAGLLDMSEAAVRKRLSRARALLREELDRDDLAATLQATAPGAAFTAAVVGALTLGAPTAAAAATVGLGKWGTGAGGKAAAGFTGAGGGALLGLLAGLFGGTLGLVMGVRRVLAQARDDEERRGILATGLVSFGAMLGFLATVWVAPRPLPVTLAFVVMLAVFWVVHFVWLPRVTSRRKAWERRLDPEGFDEREQKERRNAVWGFTIGTLLGGAAVVATWFF